ncbi:CDP-glucose 4,6-dehydratase [Palleronia marisminoris]|uniref:CDP-glucose 4,6-dehydratase n=1 Tax=Palleronia marisminoris TaxID=315423 RepID=A0A1Y5S8F1_9RHOB|nr:CDP-glucose 4,6-dehydratase [Palleronia marisminoris]SFG67830.1 CDP-glucose 4,6-dehydratase [Palleronia marisminoris]SLN34488.1 CDP-glucose 4,6-dehydratase [Palleronia marisminoris]
MDLSRLDGCRVLLTGHTGFKGGWMAHWLTRLGASVTGLALPAEDPRGVWHAARLSELVDNRVADIRDAGAVATALDGIDADLVIHMAAQSLVRPSYEEPVETFATNVMGTAHVLEAARRMSSLRAVIVVTSDKCYDNREWLWGYRENDPMGGKDPYSASKGCTELLAASWRHSFFSDPAGPQLATVRAGNVVGGGDWSRDRLVPDFVRATLAAEPIRIRSPQSVRPWQHVLEPLAGYLALAHRMLGPEAALLAEGWNFGPDPRGVADVETVCTRLAACWPGDAARVVNERRNDDPPEANLLRLDSTKAETRLGWRPRLTLDATLSMTADWYIAQSSGADMRTIGEEQIQFYRGMAA